MEEKFLKLNSLDLSAYIEKKGNLSYVSWANCWREFKKIYPEATYKINPFDGTYCSGNEKMGYMVQTEVTAGEQTYEMWLPVMDMRNNTILQPKMTEINKTIMRCLTKNLAMFGLGLYIYAGEDLPNDDAGDNDDKKPENKPKNGANSNVKAKPFQPITKAEMVEKWGVKNVEETVAWFEKKLGVKMANWNEDMTNDARAVLEAQKAKREREAEKMREQLKNTEGELPFDL